MAAKTYRSRENRFAPALRNQPAERFADAERFPVPGRRAEQSQSKDRAPMGVDAARCLQHGPLGRDPDRTQSVHSAARGAGDRQISKERRQEVGASAQKLSVHVAVRPIVDMADEPGLWKGLHFELQAQRRETAKLLRMVLDCRPR